MSTTTINPQFLIDRAAVAAIVKAKKCKDVKLLYDFVEYQEMLNMLFEFNSTFSCASNLSYLDDILEAFDPLVLNTYRIRHNEVLVDLSNYYFLSKCTVSGVLTIDINVPTIVIANNSTINKIHVTAGAQVESIIISGNSVVSELKVDNDGSVVKNLSLLTCPGPEATTATLTLINSEEKNVQGISALAGSTFGGFICPDYSTTTVPATTTVPLIET